MTRLATVAWGAPAVDACQRVLYSCTKYLSRHLAKSHSFVDTVDRLSVSFRNKMTLFQAYFNN